MFSCRQILLEGWPFFLLASAGLFFAGRAIEADDVNCTLSMSSWSPASDAIHYHWETFQNGFSQKSMYRGAPTPALEAAWSDLLQKHPIRISRDRGDRNWDPSDGTILEDANGESLAYLEVFRNLGCLNLLRQHTYRGGYDYSFLKSFQGSETNVMARVDGCVQRLREVLMCASDATPYLIMRTPNKAQQESPDFNTLHYCRDFNKILEWTRDNEKVDGESTPYSLVL